MKRKTNEETMSPFSFGMLLPCLRTQYLLRRNGVVAMFAAAVSFFSDSAVLLSVHFFKYETTSSDDDVLISA